MNISIFLPQSVFTSEQITRMKSYGNVNFTSIAGEMSVDSCVEFGKDSEILGLDPDNFGGFEKARERVVKVLDACPKLVGITLATTSYGWIDVRDIKKRNITVSNVPGYSRESVAEHTIALLFTMAKRILITDRKTIAGAYEKELGFELAGKTLGIIGLGNIGVRTAELAKGIGMNVIAYNRTPKQILGVNLMSLEEVLKQSDAIAIHLTHTDENEQYIDMDKILKMKKGVIIVNTAHPGAVDEQAMAKAILSGHVDMYTCEGTLFKGSPLEKVDRAIGLNGFGYYTKEAIQNLFEIFVQNICTIAQGKPQNLVTL